jgi:predicted NBD/HSP70 family sugar kinase
MAEPQTSVGVDVGGTRIKAAAVSPDGKIVAQRIEPTVDDVSALIEEVGDIIQELAAADAAIGVSAPDIAARNNRLIAWMRGRIEAAEGLDWQRRLN